MWCISVLLLALNLWTFMKKKKTTKKNPMPYVGLCLPFVSYPTVARKNTYCSSMPEKLKHTCNIIGLLKFCMIRYSNYSKENQYFKLAAIKISVSLFFFLSFLLFLFFYLFFSLVFYLFFLYFFFHYFSLFLLCSFYSHFVTTVSLLVLFLWS
jgi:hypothetical protein